jgi:L-malate glycosyltransferase
MDSPFCIGILCHPTYGGSGVVASELALSLAERGHKVHVFSHKVPPRLARLSGPVEVHRSQGLPYPLFASTPHDLAITSRVLEVHRSEGLDILHAHYALPHTVSAFLARSAAEKDARCCAPRVVTTLHGTDVTIVGRDPSYAALTQFLIATSDAATAVSQSLAEQTRQYFCMETFSDCPIEVIPNFVDTDHFRPALDRKGSGMPPQAIHVSNFRPVKRVPWLIEAFAAATEGTAAQLTLVGDGPDQPIARRRAEELGISDRVAFLGERSALPEILVQADVFLLGSTEESFGLSALEAMSCGLAVVATGVGGVPEVVRHEETGLLAAPDDASTFAAHLRRLLFHPEARDVMGRAARTDVVQRFGRDEVVSQYEDLYRRTLERDCRNCRPSTRPVGS